MSSETFEANCGCRYAVAPEQSRPVTLQFCKAHQTSERMFRVLRKDALNAFSSMQGGQKPDGVPWDVWEEASDEEKAGGWTKFEVVG